jgi:hypothetical protein
VKYQDIKSLRPLPKIVAMRKALRARPPAPLAKILEQVAAARKFHATHVSALYSSQRSLA